MTKDAKDITWGKKVENLLQLHSNPALALRGWTLRKSMIQATQIDQFNNKGAIFVIKTSNSFEFNS